MTTLTIIVFILAALIGSGVAAFVVHKGKQMRRKRALSVIAGKAPEKKDDGTAKTDKDADTDKTKSNATDIAKKLKKAARENYSDGAGNTIASMILQSGLQVSVAKFWTVSALLATVFSGIILASGVSKLVAFLLIFTAYAGAPRFFLKFKAARRQKVFLADFADALEAMIRLIKAGMPVSEAVAMVSREFSGPVGEEMGRVYDAQKVGTPLPEAVRKMIPRMPLPEVQMFATAIAIQVQTGSSLSEVLGNLSGVIRARARLKRKVQALSAEAKASASIIGCLPVLVSLALWGVNPKYISLLFTDPTGKMLLFGAICWMGIGILMMKQMINFRV